jgi:hypothetical protein
MDKISIANLEEIIDTYRYDHIQIETNDMYIFTRVPWVKRKYYLMRDYANGKVGFFNNGKTALWQDYAYPFSSHLEAGHLKIATEMPENPTSKCWSDSFSFTKEGDPLKISKYMKLKVFW